MAMPRLDVVAVRTMNWDDVAETIRLWGGQFCLGIMTAAGGCRQVDDVCAAPERTLVSTVARTTPALPKCQPGRTMTLH
jgi:hypothetical protein